MECASNVVALIPYVIAHATIRLAWDSLELNKKSKRLLRFTDYFRIRIKSKAKPSEHSLQQSLQQP